MRFFRSMKYQIVAAAALLLSGPYITSAADPADEIQWSESVPVDEKRYPGERVEAYIVDGLLHARRLDQNDIPLWHLILAEADPDHPNSSTSALALRRSAPRHGALLCPRYLGSPRPYAAHRQHWTETSQPRTYRPQNGMT